MRHDVSECTVIDIDYMQVIIAIKSKSVYMSGLFNHHFKNSGFFRLWFIHSHIDDV